MTVLDKIIDYVLPASLVKIFSPDPPTKTVLVMDWFGDRDITGKGFVTFIPKRCKTAALPKAFDTLVDGELIVDIEERRIFQLKDGEIIEWGRKK